MYKLGWLKDLVDFRDYSLQTPSIQAILKPVVKPTVLAAKPTVPISSVDLRQWCSPIADQGNLSSCTANAAAGIVEYFQNKTFGKFIPASRLFIYKTTRDLLCINGDSGAYLRSTMGALVAFGVPAEKYWPYTTSKFDVEPPAFLYSLGTNYKATQYFRLDPIGTSPIQVLANIKQTINNKLPIMFGFSVYSSIPFSAGTGDIPYPSQKESLLGGHAVVIVGYDDNHVIGTNKGALLIRNSWGTNWGNKGYGWLPYSYVVNGLACDFWTLVQESFLDTSVFN